MLNHARTLLLNVAATDTSLPGSELVPSDFKPVVLSDALRAVRQVLFGAQPDAWMLNYRGRQCLTVLHAVPQLTAYVTDLDPRLSYDLQDAPFVDQSLFAPLFEDQAGADVKITLTSAFDAPDASGRMLRQWDFSLSGGSVTNSLRGSSLVNVNTSSVSGFLAGSNVSFRTSGTSGATVLTKVTRPARSLADLLSAAARLGQEASWELFGEALQEPYKTFHNLYTQHHAAPFRLGGLLLALIYRTEELR